MGAGFGLWGAEGLRQHQVLGCGVAAPASHAPLFQTLPADSRALCRRGRSAPAGKGLDGLGAPGLDSGCVPGGPWKLSGGSSYLCPGPSAPGGRAAAHLAGLSAGGHGRWAQALREPEGAVLGPAHTLHGAALGASATSPAAGAPVPQRPAEGTQGGAGQASVSRCHAVDYGHGSIQTLSCSPAST